MAGEIAYKLTADEKAAVDAIRKVAEAYSGVEGGVKKVSEATKALEREQAEMGRLAKRIMEEAKTPAELYHEEIAKINKLFRDGQIDVRAYESATKKAHDQMVEAGKAGNAAFGSQAVNTLTGYVTGLLSVSAAIGAVERGFKEMERIEREAAQRSRESEFGYGALAEVSKGSPEQFQKNVAKARDIARTAGMSENQATKLTFAMISAGVPEAGETFANAYRQGVVQDPEVLLRSSTAMRKAFGNRKGTEELLDLAFKAAEGSPSQATALLSASAEAGAYARMAGFDEKQLLAATAVNAGVLDTSGGASVGGTGVRALFKAMGRLREKQEPAPTYSEEEYQRDKEALAKEKNDALADAKRAAKRDPQYLAEIKEAEIEKATLSRKRLTSPQTIAERNLRLRQIGESEQDALRASERRVEESPQFAHVSSSFKLREDQLTARRKASASGIATDDEGTILDEETKKIRIAASSAIAKAGPHLIDQLRSIKEMNLGNAQLQKVFGRSEGLVAMSNILANEGSYNELMAEQAAGKGYFRQVLSLPSTDPVLQASKLERIGKSKRIDSDRPYATEEQIYNAVQSAKYTKLGMAGKALQNIVGGAISWIPGEKRSEIEYALQRGSLNDEPELRRAAVNVLGGTDQAFGTPQPNISTAQLKEQKALYEAAEKLRVAAEKQSAAADKLHSVLDSKTRASGPLGSPHGDPGDRH
jgi:hypothetical protein